MSKYKVGDKVVMKIISADQDEIKTYSVSGVNDNWRWCLPQNLLERYIEPLSTYTEPLEAKIRRQAAEITRLLAENKELKEDFEKSKIVNLNAGRLAGQNEAWELAKKCMLMTDREIEAIFGSGHNALYGVLTYFDYRHAAAKVAEWEKAKAKEKICVGDVVRFKGNNRVEFCVTDILDDSFLYGINAKGGIYSDTNIEFVEKTGRHIDIDSFLKQIGGEQE